MTSSLTDQLACSRAVLDQMRRNQSRWIAAQEGVVKTVERAMKLEEVTEDIVGKKTEQVEVK